MATPSVYIQEPEPVSVRNGSSGGLIVIPVRLASLEELECPICQEPYSEPNRSGQPAGSEQECAVKVDLLFEWFGRKRCCGHVIGRRCLEKQLNGSGAWRNKCPVCRDVWFHEVAPQSHARLESDARLETNRSTEFDSSRRRQRGRRVAARMTTNQTSPERGMHDRPLIGRVQRRGRLRQPPNNFTRRLRSALGVEQGTDVFRGTTAELEENLKRLYQDMEDGNE